MASQSHLRILGLDPGLGITGYAVLDTDGARIALLEAGAITGDSATPLADRLASLYKNISDIIEEFKVDGVALEGLYSHYKHPVTAIKMGHARGVMVLAAGILGVPVHTYGATRIKKALTGNGHASKGQMQQMVKQKLNLAEPPHPADVADAIAAAMCHLHNLDKSKRLPGRGMAASVREKIREARGG